MSSSSVIPVAVVLLTTGALGVGAASQVTEVPADLEDHLDRLLADTMQDLTVRWLEVPAANGIAANGTVTEADLLVRLSGGAETVHLPDAVVLGEDGDQRELVNVTAIRDEDGSVEEGTITREDLVRVQIALEEPMREDEERTLLVEEPGKATLELVLTSPRSIQGQHPTLDVDVRG